jgi:hypothetical protein
MQKYVPVGINGRATVCHGARPPKGKAGVEKSARSRGIPPGGTGPALTPAAESFGGRTSLLTAVVQRRHSLALTASFGLTESSSDVSVGASWRLAR